MSDNIIQVNKDLIHTELKVLVKLVKNIIDEALNAMLARGKMILPTVVLARCQHQNSSYRLVRVCTMPYNAYHYWHFVLKK